MTSMGAVVSVRGTYVVCVICMYGGVWGAYICV